VTVNCEITGAGIKVRWLDARDVDVLARQAREAVAQARQSRGCRDFVVAADPIEPDRVNVYEEWESEEALLTFRGGGPGEDLTSSIVRADVSRHVVASSGPP